MSIHSLSDHDLRTLVQQGSPRFRAEARRELDFRGKSAVAASVDERPVEAQPNPVAFPNGRWTP